MTRKFRSLILTAVAAAALTAAVPTTASAEVYPQFSLGLSDTKLGAHPDISIFTEFAYSKNIAQADDLWDETTKHIVLDLPRGLTGNPNAIPYEERCEPLIFETGNCPPSSIVGEIFVQLESLGTVEEYIDYGWDPDLMGGLVNAGGELALLKTDPEVPAEIGMKVATGISGFSPEYQRIKIEPDTNGDLQLRTTTINPIVNEQPLQGNPTLRNNLRVLLMEIIIYGGLPNGNAFMTNSTACETWTSNFWAQAWNLNSNADSDPLRSGSNQFVKAPSVSITPDCSNQSAIPFMASGNVAISSPDRDTSPAFDFTIENPGMYANGQVSTSPKKIVTTIPASINVDVQQLSRNCLVAQFDADQCPAGSRVGSVVVETPLLRPGLSGDVYLVKRDGAGLPDLGLRLRGAISFTQRGRNSYVGDKFNQIETVFDNIPQLGFSKLKFHLDGGENGLLRTLSCPTYNKEPAVPSFSYTFTSWTGASKSSTTPLNMKNCFGIQKLKSYSKCLHKKLPVHPNYQSRARIKQVSVTIDGKRRAVSVKRPFRWDFRLEKLKLKQKKKHSLALKALYDDGTISEKKTTFRVCK